MIETGYLSVFFQRLQNLKQSKTCIFQFVSITYQCSTQLITINKPTLQIQQNLSSLQSLPSETQLMIQIHPLQFVEVALTLGYTQQQLYPTTLQQLEQQCHMLTKKMAPKQKEFYLQKKMMIYESRRQKILKEVQNHARILKSKLDKYNKYNPKVKEIIEQHQKSLKKQQKYNEVRSRASSRSNSNSNRKIISNTIDFGRTSPVISNRSSISRTSQTSRQINSQVSNRSNRTSSSANSLTRSKLQQVRQKEKEQQQLKKRILLEKQRQDQLKLLKAQENAMNKSRKAKIRSQISQKIVKENKLQMDIIKNLGAKDHLQSLKFNIAKTHHQRQKRHQSISLSQKKDIEIYFANHANKQIQLSREQKNRYKMEEKLKHSSEWQSQYNSLKMRNLQFTHNENQVREKLANERRSFQEREEKKFREQVRLFEQKRINDAQKRREQEIAKRKLSGISQQIKREIVNKNKKSIQTSQSMRKQIISKHYNEKIQELSYINNLKYKLKSGELNFGTLNSDKQQNSSLVSKQSANEPRRSITSKNNRYAYFNTILY